MCDDIIANDLAIEDAADYERDKCQQQTAAIQEIARLACSEMSDGEFRAEVKKILWPGIKEGSTGIIWKQEQ